MLKVIGVSFIVYAAEPHDADLLANIRVQAMRESLEALGRFDPERARERFLKSFACEDTFKLVSGQQILGFYVLRDRPDHIWLDHLYLHPSAQGTGIGAAVIARIKAHAVSNGKPIRLGALKQSKANAFYQRHGFQHTHSEDFDNYYELPLESIEPSPPVFILKRAEPEDIEQLANLRHEAMKDEWAANGLTDYALARRHFFEDYKPEATLKIALDGELLGFTAVHEYQDYIHLDMIYLHPKAQGQGIGAQIVANIKQHAVQVSKPIRLGALRVSNSNKFYQAQGFNFTHNVEFNNYYQFTPEPVFQFETAAPENFEELQHIRYTAMKESAEANGLFQHDKAREIFLSEYAPEKTRKILRNGKTIGFYVVLNHPDHLYLDMFYLLPEAQGLGIGSKILQQIKDQADEQNKPIRLDALRISRANAFYQHHGFHLTHSEGVNNYYEYAPKCSKWCLEPANSSDFDLLADLCHLAMKDNMEANGMFDHELYRQYFKDSFDPASTWKIIENEDVLGFYVLWDKQNHLYLERLYFHPNAQGRGIGAKILNLLKQQATTQTKPIRLEVLPKSRANAFYLRQGFELVEEREEETVYKFAPDSSLA
ncbi:Protein N-acetyltransferase, RimJ/RimL family [Pseudovibrio ascidiaceicola]|uniref:Protein N-acetyltransferase, RimJ/RimL family n=1 Tax=Pseudovibrio ascidiaceicola TaxID=285279 RepID=A0A1I3WQH4_9HYPH|nr:Protein N-acetyltransferase, RimJ/RimL family [Pseudovibrio ascidiaceicola]